MTEKEMTTLYNDIIELPSGTRTVNFDLHIHTPASSDYISMPKIDKTNQYIMILNEALQSNIELIAITDHNTFEGFNTIHQILKNDSTKAFKNLKVLCGIEITCFSKHLLAIFPETFTKRSQDKFLEEIGIDCAQRGTENAIADILGPSVLIEKIDAYGGFSILAHADAQSGFLHSWCRNQGEKFDEFNFTGKSLAKIMNSKSLLGIQICNDKNVSKIAQKLSNADYRKQANQLPFLRFSDSHGYNVGAEYYGKSGRKIGSVFSQAKLSVVSFTSIMMALHDAKMRIISKEIKKEYTWIIGCAIKGSFFTSKKNEYYKIHFNPEMNCIIGPRGSGKSTLLDIVQSVINYNYDLLPAKKNIKSRYSSAIIYISSGNEIYAIAYKPVGRLNEYTDEISYLGEHLLYKRTSNIFKSVSFNENNLIRDLFFFVGYKQHQLYDYSQNSKMITEIVDDFIKWKDYTIYSSAISQIDYNRKKLLSLLEDAENSRDQKPLYSYILDNELLDEIIRLHTIISKSLNTLIALRENMTFELNKVLAGKVKLSLTKWIVKDEYDEIVNQLPKRVKKDSEKYSDFEIKIKDVMKKVCSLAKYTDSFNFIILLLENKIDELSENYKLNLKKEIWDSIKKSITPNCIMVFNDSYVSMKYNINTGIKHSKEIYKDNTELSIGQNAVALLLLILNASYDLGDNRPLFMDQPEDDLDNSYIYTTLVQEFRKSKPLRQLIISTHNPNIPVSSDAENIMILQYNGINGYLADSGSIDKPSVCNGVLEILEGGKDALKLRSNKYNYEYNNY